MTGRRADLIALLTAYQPADADEQMYRLQMLDLAAAALDPFDRGSYGPGHFTASGFVIHPDGDRILLIHHAKIGAWLQPGGHIDPEDPDPMAAARREIAEETGLTDLLEVGTAIVDLDVHLVPERGEQPEHRHFDVRFAFVATADALDTNHEVHEARWVGSGELADVDADRSLIRPFEKLLGEQEPGGRRGA